MHTRKQTTMSETPHEPTPSDINPDTDGGVVSHHIDLTGFGGSAPEHTTEGPQSVEFDPANNAEDKRLLDEALAEEEAKDEAFKLSPEEIARKRKLRRRFILGLVATGVGVVTAVSLWNIFGNQKADVGPTPVDTPRSEPTPTVTESPSPSPTQTVEQMFDAGPAPEGIIKTLESPSTTAEQFNAASKQDQLKWLSWKTNNNIKAYAAEFSAASNNQNDIYPSDISINSSPQNAMTDAIYKERVAGAMDNALDAHKALIASLPDGMSDGGYATRLAAAHIDSYIPFTPNQETAVSVMPTIDSSTDILTDSSGRQYRQVVATISGPDGNGIQQTVTLKYNLFFYTYTDYQGNKQSTWLAS